MPKLVGTKLWKEIKMLRTIGLGFMGFSSGIVGAYFGLPIWISAAILTFAIGVLLVIDSIINNK